MKTQTHSLDLWGEPIYLISDLHSNLPALEAVLRGIPEEAVILCAGDVLGYYLEPNEVCDLLRARSVLCIQGNHDKYVLGELDYSASKEEKYRIIATRSMLTAENLNWLAALPDALLLELFSTTGKGMWANHTIRVAHGSPRSVEEYIYPDTPIDFLAEATPGFLVLGHTHHPMVRQTGSLTIVNPGSVGQIRNKIPGASYAVLNPRIGDVNLLRAQYDIARYQQRLRDKGVSQGMIEILSRTTQ